MVNIITSPKNIDDIIKLKEAGANTIICGMPFFSVRAVSHFTNEEIKIVRSMTKKLEMDLYVLMNRFFVEKEMDAMKKQLSFLKEVGVDGIYFTDMGVFEEASNLNMEHVMIYNPDTLLTNHMDVQAYLDLGIKMCTLAKEITLENMVKIANKVEGEMEVIVHGRLNMMHSKRTLLTNYMKFLGNESDLRNKQTLYLMEENREEHMPIVEDEHGTHVYTGFTLCTFEEVEDLMKAGIRNLRIESMFMEIEEICEIIKDYHKVILDPAGGRSMYQKYQKQYPHENITKGFLYKKTGLLKE